MFEHLGSSRQSYQKKSTNFKFYVWFLLLALFVYVSAWGLSQGTVSSANNQPELTAVVSSQPTIGQQIVVKQTPKFSVFDFTINTDLSLVFLQKLKISIATKDYPAWLSDLYLYHNNQQLGQIDKIVDGQIYFDLGQYNLDKGENYFQLILNTTDQLPDQAFSFSIQEPMDIVLDHAEQIFIPQGDFPILGQKFITTENGQLLAYNNLAQKNFFVPANRNKQLADFSLASLGETIILKQLIVDYATRSALTDLADSKFYLTYDEQVISQAKPDNQQLIFDLPIDLIIKNNQDVNLQLGAVLPSTGDYVFTLTEVGGKGFISGSDIKWQDSLILSQVKVLADVPYFDQSDRFTTMSAGWNNLFSVNISSTADNNINIHKLTWQIENYGSKITALELWVDNQRQDAELTLRNNKITAIFEKPLVILGSGIDLQLLIKVMDLSSDVRLQANLLADTMAEVNENDNILWSLDDEMHNGYLLPNFPLDPVILTY